MRRTIVVLAAAAALWPAAVFAQDCKLEHWKTRHNAVMGMFIIEGITTCDSGRIIMKLFDGEGEGKKLGIIYIPRHQAVSGSSSAGASGRSAALKIASRISSAVAGSGSITYFGGRPRPRFGVAASTLSECATAAASRPCRERPRPSASGCRDRGHCGARRIRSRNAGGASGSSGDRCPDIRA